ncbi:MAG: NAD(P)-dependent alcohol dehydrogenase [Armatimonadetes bacterium]|nr:NAD(P)-dependent alcohol dehydrogenase [Armatimonadota bacterium]
MPDTMQAAVMHGIRDVRLEARPVPEPAPHEVLVRIGSVGVCASDVHYFTHGRIGGFVVRAPLILGHEAAGVVVAVGREVTRFTVGQRVTMEPGWTCGRCWYCKTGRYNLCPDVVFMATPPIDGAFAEYVAWPESFTYALPDELSLAEGALMEPLSVGVWATQRGQVAAGQSVAVIGAGPIGLVVLQMAKIRGATTLVAVDIEPFRLELARKLGATHCLSARDCDPVACIRELTGELQGFPPAHAGVDAAFETAGTLATTRTALGAVRPGGQAVLVGLPPDPLVELDIVSAASREISIHGEFRYANTYPTAIALTAARRVDVAALVTHRFDLAEAAAALQFADEHKHEAMKVVVDVAAE